MTGRPRKPTQLKIVEGTARKDRMNSKEPKPDVIAPVMPGWLSPKAKTAWKELSGVLLEMGVLTVPDRKALELLCDAYGEWRDARAVIEKQGMTYQTTTQHGDTMYRARPEVAMAQNAWSRVMAGLVQFGLTPASRSKVSANDPTPTDPLSEFIRRK